MDTIVSAKQKYRAVISPHPKTPCTLRELTFIANFPSSPLIKSSYPSSDASPGPVIALRCFGRFLTPALVFGAGLTRDCIGEGVILTARIVLPFELLALLSFEIFLLCP